jgi:hypothetical protein
LKRFIPMLLLVADTARAEEPVSFSGFIDVAYLWNANRPTNHENFIPGTGTSGKRANEFTLNLAQVQWSRAVSAEQPVGFTLSLVAGEGTEVVHAGEPKGGDVLRHIYQASVAYRLRNGVVLEAGVYPSHIGLEGFYSKDNWNYTRSWLGELSPYYQAGVKASYAFNARWSGQLHVLNGWQLINDNNDGKAIGTQLAWSSGPLTASLNTFVDADRTFADVVVLYRVRPRLQLGASGDVGSQEHAQWRGGGAYARYAIDDHNAVAVRAEHFRDPEAGISGTARTLHEATVTYEMHPREHVILKLETRYDRSTAPVFTDQERSQFLVLAGAVVTF